MILVTIYLLCVLLTSLVFHETILGRGIPHMRKEVVLAVLVAPVTVFWLVLFLLEGEQ